MKTACGKCKWSRSWAFWIFCIASDDDVFDYMSGRMVKSFDLAGFAGIADVSKYPSCAKKNKGDCPDFTPDGETG